MIEDIVFHLDDKFPEVNFDLGFEVGKYMVIMDCYETYQSKRFKNIVKVLRLKNPSVKFFCAYKSILYGK